MWRPTKLLALPCLQRHAAWQQSLSVALANRRRPEVGAPRRQNPHDPHPTMLETEYTLYLLSTLARYILRTEYRCSLLGTEALRRPKSSSTSSRTRVTHGRWCERVCPGCSEMPKCEGASQRYNVASCLPRNAASASLKPGQIGGQSCCTVALSIRSRFWRGASQLASCDVSWHHSNHIDCKGMLSSPM